MSEADAVTAAVIIIGNEVLSGRTRDANLAYLGKALDAAGVRLREARVIPDDAEVIVETVNEFRERFGYVFTTGGIGPTHDDITSACVARAFGATLHRNAEAEALLRRHYRPEDVNEARLKMADVPEGATLIANPVSAAPGFQLGNVFVLPGVPRIMQAMFEGLRYRLAGGAPMVSTTVAAFVTEGAVAAGLAEAQAEHPTVEIGSYPFVRDGRLGTSLVVRAPDAAAVEAAAVAVEAAVRAAGGEPMREDG